MKRTTLCNGLCSSSSFPRFSTSLIWNIGNSEQQVISQATEQLIQFSYLFLKKSNFSGLFLVGDYMIPVFRDEISNRPAGADFTYDYMWKLNFASTRRDSFPPGICLDLYAFSLDFH